MGKATVDEGEGKDNNDNYDNDNDNDDNNRESIDPYEEKVDDDSTKMPPTPLASAAGKTAGKTAAAATTAKKNKDPTGVAGIIQKLQASSLQPQVVRFSFKTEFPFLLSPTGIFNDGMRRICLDFLAFLCIKTSTRLSWMTASLSSCL